MSDYWGLVCAFGIFYTIVLIIYFYFKGILNVIWCLILAGCFLYNCEINPGTGLYVLNETLVPVWIFEPTCLIGSPFIAFVIVVSIRWGQIDAGG